MDTDSFFIYIKIKDAYKGVTDDVKKRFDTPNYQVDRPLPTPGGRLDMYDFFLELFPDFDTSEVEQIWLESSHTIFGCFPYQLEIVFSTTTISRSETFR